ncbi:MAG: hypothetical protein QX197_09585 [Methylococcaceae bacterium]
MHGALGDVYEQALSFKLLKEKYANDQLIAFFSCADRLEAFKHYNLDMFDEIHLWDKIPDCNIDRFDQFQINDGELRADILAHLSSDELRKFDFEKAWLPWSVIRTNNYAHNPVRLVLSDVGLTHYAHLLALYGLTEENITQSVGYLWRYRAAGGAIKPYGQASKEDILKTKSDLFKCLTEEYGLHVIVAGMNYQPARNSELSQERNSSGVLDGEINAKFTGDKLAIPDTNVTYLQGLGYAAELEIIARTRFQLLMPSGFSEPIWMMNGAKTLLVDPPPIYLLKLIKNRMPLFDNVQLRSFLYNCNNCHSSTRVLSELKKRQLL